MSNTAKSLLISEIFPPIHGGSGRWFWELYSRLPREYYYIAAGDSPAAARFDQAHNLHVQRLNLFSKSWGIRSFTGLKFYFRIFRQIRKVIRTHKIKAIHCGRCVPEGVIGYMFKIIYRIPYLCFVHGEDVATAATSRELSWVVRKILKNASLLICNSQNSKMLLINDWWIKSDKVAVLNPGVDTGKFAPKPHDIISRNKLGWGDRPVILTVGRLQKRKGHDKMISALAEIKQHHPNILYAIVGDGEEMAFLRNQVIKLELEKNVQFLNEISDDDLIKCYQQCDLFILPNRTEGKDIEGFGMVLVEAQSCEKPVIAGNSGGTAETMIVGETGYIIDCTDPAEIAVKINELITGKQKANEMGKAGRINVIKSLDWETHTQRATDLFCEHL